MEGKSRVYGREGWYVLLVFGSTLDTFSGWLGLGRLYGPLGTLRAVEGLEKSPDDMMHPEKLRSMLGYPQSLH